MTKSARAGLAVAVAAALTAPAAFATNGYFAHGYSIKEKGLVGAGVALPQDSLAAATNPAGMVMVGGRIDAGASLFSPRRSYTVSGGPSPLPAFGLVPETVDSDSEYFLIPHFGWNKMLDSDSSFGVSVYGNGGMNTDYPKSAGGGAGTFYGGAFGGKANTGVDLAQLFVNVSYARKITPTSSWGVSPVFAYQRFKATGLAAFGAFGFSSDPNNLTDNGYDSSTGFGLKAGIAGEVAPGVTLGGSYQTKMNMSEFDKYKGLFAEKGDFDIPATATVGLAWKATPSGTVVFDVQKIWYSDVAAVGNPMLPNLTTSQLGNNNGAGFGWDDMTIYKLGYQWNTAQDWTWRVGYSKGDQPIPSSEVLFNILAPAVMEQQFTFGFTTQLSKSSEFTFAAMYAPEEEVKGTNPLDPAQTITLRMDQYELAASWGWKF